MKAEKTQCQVRDGPKLTSIITAVNDLLNTKYYKIQILDMRERSTKKCFFRI